MPDAMPPVDHVPCEGCGAPSEYSIVLAKGLQSLDGPAVRFYLPNQHAREKNAPPLATVWFCATCMRGLEDSFRATLLYLQIESGRAKLVDDDPAP